MRSIWKGIWKNPYIRGQEKVAYDKDDAPLRKIFGPTEKRMLNLITCTGYFDHDIHNYVERLVVYTELVDDQINES